MAFLLPALFSCATKPSWITKTPRDSTDFYFVGMNIGAKTLEQGQDAAIKNAMGKIANYLGTHIESVSEQNVTEIEQKLKLQIRAKSQAQVQGAKAADWFIEEKEAKYDVYVLVKIPKSKIGKELSRQQHEKLLKANTAYDLYLLGGEKEDEQNYREAADFYKQSLEVLNELEDVVPMNRGAINNSRNLQALVRTARQKASTAARQLVLSVNVNGPDGAKRVFDDNLAAALERKGFKRNTRQAAIEIQGEVLASESGFTLNNFVFYAEGNLFALRKSDHQVIGTVPFKTKAFGADKTQAALNALAQAASEAGHDLGRILLEVELHQEDNTIN